MLSVSNHSCCGCVSDPCSNCPPVCKPITSADLADLIYIAGLDINYCKKYQAVADVLGLVDCNGDPIIPGQPIVTCAQMQEQLCEIFSAFVSGGVLVPGTVVVGANCQTYTFPAFQAPLTVADGNCIDLTLVANNLNAEVIINPDDSNATTCTINGLYTPDVCTQLAALPGVPIPATDATVLVSAGSCTLVNLTNYQENITVLDTTCLDLNLAAGVLSGSPVVSPNAGNQLSCSPNGLLVPAAAAETPITPIDTPSVNLTVSGVNSHTLQADVVISPDAGNSVVILPNGVYVPDVCTQFEDIVGAVVPATGATVFVDRDCNLVSLPAVTEITVDDTVTVDLTLTAGEITADVNVSAVAGNSLVVLGDGLYVPVAVTDVNITGVDTNCIDTTVTEGPANTFSVSSVPIISPAVGNQVSCTAQGLFVPAATGQVTCESVTGVFDVTVDALDPGDGVLTDTCEIKLFPDFIALDTASVNTSVTRNGAGDFVFSADTVVAATAVGFPAACNGLVAGAGGLYAPPNSTGNQASVPITSTLYSGPLAESQVESSPTFTVNITNPSDCRSAILVLEVHIPALFTFNIDPGVSLTEFSLFHTYNLPGVLIQPSVQLTQLQLADNDTAAVAARPGSDMWRGTYITQFVVPPSFVGSYSVNAVVEQVTGDTDITAENPGVSYFLFTI